MLKLSYHPFTLRLRNTFRISQGERSSSPLILTKIRYKGIEGYGEGSMPALYGESHKSALEFLSQVDLTQFDDPFDVETILEYVDSISSGNSAAKTSVDIALHDLIGKLVDKPVHSILGLPYAELSTSMTIGIDTPENMAQKAIEYKDFAYLKIKLGTQKDKEIIKAVRKESNQPFFIDANQGWEDQHEALDMIEWLKEEGTVFIEQPMPKENKNGNAWLTERSPLPIIGDEGIQRLEDLKDVAGIYSGINIKLMKSTGIREGFKLAIAAKALGMKVMLGCMSETSCAISAASQLGALADWVDLDGNLDAVNDPFSGSFIQDGKLLSTGLSGIGIQKPEIDLSDLGDS